MTTFIFYSLLPLFILAVKNIMVKSREGIYFGFYDLLFIISIFLFLPMFYSPYLLLLAYALIFYVIFYIVLNFKIMHVKKIAISLLILLVSTLSVMTFFLLPNYYGISSTLSQVGSGPFVSTLHYWTELNSQGLFYSLLNNGFIINSQAPSLFGWTWLKFYASSPFLIIITITIPIFSFSTLFFIRRFKAHLNRDIWFFYFLAFTGIVLQAGFKGPTGSFYNWLFYHIVFIRAFDTLHLWYSPIIYLSYALLVGVFIYLLIEFISGINAKHDFPNNKIKSNGMKFMHTKLNRKITSYIIVFLILVIVMIPSYPVLDGSAVPHGLPSAEVHLPDYVTQTSDYLNSRSNTSTVLTMPLFIDDDQEDYPTGGYRGANPLQYLLADPIINQLNGVPALQSEKLTELNTQIEQNNDKLVNYYLSSLDIKYILVLGDYNSTYNPILTPFTLNNTMDTLNNDPNITLVKEYGPYYIYKYEDGHSLVYPSISINNNNQSQQYGNNLISSTMKYSYTNWGNKYSNMTLTSSGLSVYFNYTKGVTWPFMEINICNISKSIQNYNHLDISFVSTPNTIVSAQANTYSNTHLWLTGTQTNNGLILNTSYNEISQLQLFLGPVNTTYNSSNHFQIESIIPSTLEKANLEKFSVTNATVPNNQSLSNIRITKVQYNNPTSITVQVEVLTASTFTLVFGQDYNNAWEIKSEAFISTEHIVVNGFMNAWVISFNHPGNYTIHINFDSEKVIYYYGYISILSSLIIMSAYIAISIRKKKVT